jgi:uncharacterized protein
MTKKMNLHKRLFFPAILLLSVTAFSQDIPERPNPPRLVNDFAGLLRSDEVNALEQKLVAFSDSTSTQIAIVIVPDLKGYDKADYGVRLANSWGIGQKGKNNGVLILVKPKTALSDGQTYIATGYGAEGAVPDLVCSDIVNNELLPAFRQNDYYGGLESATNILMSLVRGEFSANDYSKKSKISKTGGAPFIIIFIFIIIMFMNSSGRNKHNSISKSGLPFWVLLGMMNSSGRSHNGSWGGFSSGGSFGGGGGFGGFGGGGFGGGGAGGSW